MACSSMRCTALAARLEPQDTFGVAAHHFTDRPVEHLEPLFDRTAQVAVGEDPDQRSPVVAARR